MIQRLTFVALLLAIWTLQGCQKQSTLSQDQAASNASFRSAMQALDAGDNANAEVLLQKSISQAPDNSDRARVMLASIYAERANVKLKDWLDPFYNAGLEIQSKAQMFKNSNALLQVVSDNINNDARNDGLTPEEEDIKRRSAALVKDAGEAALGLMVTMDVFHEIPFLNDTQLAELDKAISELLPTAAEPTSSGEVRVYLAVLSVVRLVNHIKKLSGDRQFVDYIKDKNAICFTPADKFKTEIEEIKTSLGYLEQGLIVYPSESQNNKRDAREKMHAFVQDMLKQSVWDHVDQYFSVGTLEQRVGLKLATDFCNFFATDPTKHEASANLFNPDDDDKQ